LVYFTGVWVCNNQIFAEFVFFFSNRSRPGERHAFKRIETDRRTSEGEGSHHRGLRPRKPAAKRSGRGENDRITECGSKASWRVTISVTHSMLERTNAAPQLQL